MCALSAIIPAEIARILEGVDDVAVPMGFAVASWQAGPPCVLTFAVDPLREYDASQFVTRLQRAFRKVNVPEESAAVSVTWPLAQDGTPIVRIFISTAEAIKGAQGAF